MIKSLYISNLAILEEANIDLNPGLNAITGETGAGKSILVNAYLLLLGGRADKGLVGNYSDRAIVEGLISVSDETVDFVNKEYGLEISNDIIITREIYEDKNSVVRLNNRVVTLSVIKDIMKYTVDIYAQNSTGLLLDKTNYLSILDSIEGEKAFMFLKDINSYFDKLDMLKKDLSLLDLKPEEVEREKDILEFQLKEISEVDWAGLDYVEILKEYTILSNSVEIQTTLSKAVEELEASDFTEGGILSSLLSLINKLRDIEEYDSDIGLLIKGFDSTYYQILDLRDELLKYSANINPDEERLYYLSSTIEKIEYLKNKYGPEIENILQFKVQAQLDLENLQKIEENREDIEKNIKEIEVRLSKTSEMLSSLRRKASKKLQLDLNNELKNLNFQNTYFEIQISKKDISRNGADDVEFLASFNLGQGLKPLSQIASGGELSRFMLALKIITAKYDKISTLIFDEIDSGISGITAEIVGNVIKRLSETYQIILVTHLAQIAVQGNQNIFIDKIVEGEQTKSTIKTIEGEDLIKEIARLMGGSNITNSVLESSRDLLTKAKK